MKKLNKKGFTIVELVIVIAVIAILAAVMVPTFTGIIKKGQDSAALQEATAKYHAAIAYADTDNVGCDGWYICLENDAKKDGFEYIYEIENGQLKLVKNIVYPANYYADKAAAKTANVAADTEVILPLSVVEALEGAAASEVEGVCMPYTLTEDDLE